jgi:hypothetical protein
MIELISIAALVICFLVISFVIRIYNKSPKIRKNMRGDDFNMLS